jgi:NADH-quinone oxidoreductase subunit M
MELTSQQLVLTLALPLGGAGLLSLVAPRERTLARCVALVVSVLTFLCAAQLVAGWAQAPPGTVHALVDADWLGEAASGIDVRLRLGLDGLGAWLFGLTALLFVTAVLVSWEAIQDQPWRYYALLLVLEFGCLGVFVARDLILFYLFFEFTLIPLFFLIGVWGSEQRQHAAVKFFLFTLAGSVLTFLGLLVLVLWDAQHAGGGVLRFSISDLTEGLARHPLPPRFQMLVFLALFAGFAIKVPLFPLHTWLPLAHVQAPTAGSVILAGILLKIGGYGFLRFSVPMLPQATATAAPWLMGLSVAGILYGALVALAQSDIKRLIAYSSVSHLGYCLLGLFALTATGVQGSVLQMVNHGLSTGALFALVGMLYERYHTRQMRDLGGLAARMPRLAFFFVLFTFSSIGVPGLNGFAGEFLILVGALQRGYAQSPPAWQPILTALAVAALLGVVLGAWYMLELVQRVLFGPLREPAASHPAKPSEEPHLPADLTFREILALAPLAVFVVWIGIRPGDFLRPMQPDLEEARRPAAAAYEASLSASPVALSRPAPPAQGKRPSALPRAVFSQIAVPPPSPPVPPWRAGPEPHTLASAGPAGSLGPPATPPMAPHPQPSCAP